MGEGGKANVWKAKDVDERPYVPGRVVAVKELRHPANPDDQQRLRREGGEDRRFDHENVVRIFDLRGGPRSPFLVMEYIAGENCKQLLSRYARFDPERVAEVGIQLCAGMGCLHASGLVHLDVKPGNLVVTGELNGAGPIGLKLIDLGIAQALSDPEQGQVVGTRPYMAPEVEAGDRATEAADVYGAGAVLYELATGRQLTPLSDQELLEWRRAAPVTPPHSLNPAVPGWLSTVIMRAISLDPRDRYESAETMGRALEEREAAASEAPTTVIGGPHEAATEVIGRAGAEPIVFRLLGALPPWLQRQLPPDWRKQEPAHWYLFLLALAAAPILFTILCLPIAVRVVATLYELPLWLLTAGVLLVPAAAWFLRDESRRRAAARAVHAAARGLQAGARSLGVAAAAMWRWASSAVARRPTFPPAEGGNPHDPGRPRQRVSPRRSPFSFHGGRRRSWNTVRQSKVNPLLQGARLQLTKAGRAARAWTLWFGRYAYFVVLMAFAFCLALWLAPALQYRVSLQPADHRTVLTAVPAAVWILVALFGFLRLRASNANPRRLLSGGVALLVVLTVIGMLMPSLAGWLEPRFWPNDQVAEARDGNPDQKTNSPAPQRTARETARLVSRRLAGRVRNVESRWIQLIWSFQHNDWTIDSGTKPAIRDRADALVSQLNGWRKIPAYEFARVNAKRWLASMRRTASKLTTRYCDGFSVGPRGASADCSG